MKAKHKLKLLHFLSFCLFEVCWLIHRFSSVFKNCTQLRNSAKKKKAQPSLKQHLVTIVTVEWETFLSFTGTENQGCYFQTKSPSAPQRKKSKVKKLQYFSPAVTYLSCHSGRFSRYSLKKCVQVGFLFCHGKVLKEHMIRKLWKLESKDIANKWKVCDT